MGVQEGKLRQEGVWLYYFQAGWSRVLTPYWGGGHVAGVGENWALAACSRHLSGEPRDSAPESHACPWLRIHFYQGTLVFWVRQVGLLMMSQACTE